MRAGGSEQRVDLAAVSGNSLRFEHPAGIEVEVPGKLRRRFRGLVKLTRHDDEIQVIVALPLRTYLASAVAAETPPDAPAAALEAQAIAARSYVFGAAERHDGGRFCDTTHCQWIRETPPPEHSAWSAVDRTRGLVLVADGRVVPGLFSRSCGGETRDGLEGADARFRSVACPVCRQLPTRWTRELPAEAAAELLQVGDSEAARVAIVRGGGWDVLPSNSFETRHAGDVVRLEGVGEGHRVGLCQRGALALARAGASAAEILRLYFPHAAIKPAER